MAILTSVIGFTGKLGDLSAYRVKGSDKIILRRKGGPSKKKIATAPQFDVTRRNNAEFGARSTFTKFLLRALHPLKYLADHNVSAPMNSFLKTIQVLDTSSELGKRSIALSRRPSLLEGFSFNRSSSFGQVVRAKLKTSIHRERRRATVVVPALFPGLNFRPSSRYSYYQLIFTIGAVEDLKFGEKRYEPGNLPVNESQETPWGLAEANAEEQFVELVLPESAATENATVIVGVGIRYGVITTEGKVTPVNHGCAEILVAG